MRKTVLLLLFISTALAGCKKPAAKNDIASATPVPSTPAPSTPAATPTPEPPKIVSATPEPKQLAPEGVFFLRIARSVESDAGIVGVKRGTQLRKTGETTYTTAEGDKLTLTPDLVTNDLVEVRQILESEHASQAALASWKQMQAQAVATQQAVVNATPFPAGTRITTITGPDGTQRTITHTTIPPQRPAAPPRPSSPAPYTGNPLSRGAYDEDKGVARRPVYIDSYGNPIGSRGR